MLLPVLLVCLSGCHSITAEGKKTFAADSVHKTIESSRHSGGGGGGVAIMWGPNGGGFGFTANANIGKGETNGNSTTYRLSHIGGLQGHTDIGDGKTLINGAQLLGKSLEGNTRDLVAISPQGTMDYDSNNFALSGFVLYGAGAALGIDYEKTRVWANEKTINKESGGRDAITSVNSNNARINAWKKDVQQNDAVANAQQATLGGQSGFFAGDDGFRIKNSGTATLEGATFVSTAKAEAEGKNHFSTDRLIRKDLENHSEYKGKSMALGLSAVFSGDKNNGTSQQIQWLGENFSPINVGESGMSSRFGYDRTNKNDRGTTYASINTANITINDAAGQQALTGESVADTIRNANRGMTLATAKEQSGAADAHFDAAKVENSVRTNAQVMKNFTGTVQEAKGELRERAEKNRREAIYQRDPEKRAAQLQRAEQQEQLAVAVDMLGGALTPTNSVAGGIANTLAPAITHKIGQEIKKRGLEGTPEHIALHTVMAGARTALNGGSTGEVLASAAITGTAEYSTPQLAKRLYGKNIDQLTAAEKSALGQTIGALATGAGAMTGGNSATAYNAGKTAQNAVENNWLTPEENARRKELQSFIDKTIEEMSSENFSYNRKLPSDEYLKAYKELRDLDELSEKRDHEFNQAYDNCRNNANCEQFYYLHVTLRDKLNKPGIEQFKRDRKNGKLEDNWKLEPNDRNAFHNFSDDGTTVPPKGLYPNAKYSHKNGQYEVIVNKNTGEIVTLPSNAGTFNYYPPGASKVSVASMHHMDYDVDPWMDFGSGRGDNTTYDSRRNNSGGLKYIFGEFGDPNYKAIDEFQRIDKEKTSNGQD
ncbi:hemagglutinin repeat-containing protein [Cardiobacterium valvarum]|nr:hemagglutinin repeat-containing protein [Cardiobacterium valvarum]